MNSIDKVDDQTGKVTASYTCEEGSKAKFLKVFARNKAEKEEDFKFAKVICDGTKRSVTVTTEHVIEKDQVYLSAQLVEAVANEPGLTKKVGTGATLNY